MEVSKPSQPKGVLVAHANARLTVHGRRLLVDRILAGHRPGDVAAQLGCSRATADKWLRRHREERSEATEDRRQARLANLDLGRRALLDLDEPAADTMEMARAVALTALHHH